MSTQAVWSGRRHCRAPKDADLLIGRNRRRARNTSMRHEARRRSCRRSSRCWRSTTLWSTARREGLRKWVAPQGRWLTRSREDVNRRIVSTPPRCSGVLPSVDPWCADIRVVTSRLELHAGLLPSCRTQPSAGNVEPPRYPTQACCFRRTSRSSARKPRRQVTVRWETPPPTRS